MDITKPQSFWDYLIWVTVLLTAFTGVGALLDHYVQIGRELRELIVLLASMLLMLAGEYPFKGLNGKVWKELMSMIAIALPGADIILKFILDAGEKSSWAGWLFPVIIILATLRLYRDYRKELEKAEKERKRIEEQKELLSRVHTADNKALILVSNTRMELVCLEADESMVLYSLPEDRFLVLFRKPVGLDDFLVALSGFRREVDTDEDAVGFYGNARYGSRPDSLQAYVSDQSGTFRTIHLELDSISLSGAEPL